MSDVEHGVGSFLTILEVLIQSQPCSSTFALLKRAMVTFGVTDGLGPQSAWN